MAKVNRKLQKEPYVFELPISMIDVVFLLLIFFIVATKFRTPEHRLEANLPKDEGQMNISKKIEKPEEIRIKMWLEGNKVVVQANEYRVASFNKNDSAGMNAMLKQLFGTLNRLREGLGELPVVVDARQNVRFGVVIGAIDTCARAKIKEVKFQAPPVPDGGGDDWWYK